MPVLGGAGSAGSGAITDRGTWSILTSYAVGDVVTFGTGRNICSTAHTSGRSFDRAKFTPLGNPAESLAAVQRGTIIDTFRDAPLGWASTGSTTATITAEHDPIVGSFMRVVTTGSARVQRPLFMDARKRFVSFKIRVPGTSGDTVDVGLELMVTQSSVTGRRYEDRVGNQAVKDKAGTDWRQVSIAWTQCNPQSGAVPADLIDVRAIGFYFTGAGTFDIADLRFHDNPLPPGVLILFDDSLQSTYDIAFPIMQAAGMVGNCYLVSGNMPGGNPLWEPSMTLAQAQEMKAAGWLWASHGQTHTRLETLTSAQRRAEFDAQYDFMVDNGLLPKGGGGAHVAYPQGGFDESSLRDAQDYYRSGRLVTAGADFKGHAPFVADRFRLNTVYLDTPYANVTSAINSTMTLGGVVSLTFHGVSVDVDKGENITTAEFQAIIDYLVEQNCPIYTLDDIFPEQTPSPDVLPVGV